MKRFWLTQILLLALVSVQVAAYNNQNRLVRCWDELVIFNKTTNEEVGAWNMTAFPYIDGVSKLTP